MSGFASFFRSVNRNEMEMPTRRLGWWWRRQQRGRHPQLSPRLSARGDETPVGPVGRTGGWRWRRRRWPHRQRWPRMRMGVAVPESPPKELGLVGVLPTPLTPLQTSPPPPPPPPQPSSTPPRHFPSPCFALERSATIAAAAVWGLYRVSYSL